MKYLLQLILISMCRRFPVFSDFAIYQKRLNLNLTLATRLNFRMSEGFFTGLNLSSSLNSWGGDRSCRNAARFL